MTGSSIRQKVLVRGFQLLGLGGFIRVYRLETAGGGEWYISVCLGPAAAQAR